MNTPNDTANAEDFEALYLAYKAKYEAAESALNDLQEIINNWWNSNGR